MREVWYFEAHTVKGEMPWMVKHRPTGLKLIQCPNKSRARKVIEALQQLPVPRERDRADIASENAEVVRMALPDGTAQWLLHVTDTANAFVSYKTWARREKQA